MQHLQPRYWYLPECTLEQCKEAQWKKKCVPRGAPKFDGNVLLHPKFMSVVDDLTIFVWSAVLQWAGRHHSRKVLESKDELFSRQEVWRVIHSWPLCITWRIYTWRLACQHDLRLLSLKCQSSMLVWKLKNVRLNQLGCSQTGIPFIMNIKWMLQL